NLVSTSAETDLGFHKKGLPQNCKVCVLSVSNFCVCLPCVVACLFPCLVLVLPSSRHVLSLCLFVCAMCPLVVVRVSTPHLFPISRVVRSEDDTSELQSHLNLVCRLLLEKKESVRVVVYVCIWLRV